MGYSNFRQLKMPKPQSAGAFTAIHQLRQSLDRRGGVPGAVLYYAGTIEYQLAIEVDFSVDIRLEPVVSSACTTTHPSSTYIYAA